MSIRRAAALVAALVAVGCGEGERTRGLELGQGLRMIVSSSNLAGDLALFRSDGSAATTRPTNEITWVQLFDLDEDGVSEVITEEIDGRGTGVLEKTFRIYRVTTNDITEVWSGESSRRHAPDENHLEESKGFLRFDAGGAGRRARVTHLVVDAANRRTESVFEWRNGALHRIVAKPGE